MSGARPTNVRGAWATILVATAATIVAPACSDLQRQAALELFFDDVPPYVRPEERARVEAEARATAEAEAAASHKLSERGKSPAQKLALFTHGPFAARECARCHDLGAASGFRPAGEAAASDSLSGADLAQGGRLRMPVTRLCVHCHTDFRPEAAENEGWSLHAPVRAGWCVMCHQPHSSPYAHLVLNEPPARLCTQCHLVDDLVAFTSQHRPRDPREGFPSTADGRSKPPGGPGSGDHAEPAQPVQVAENCTACHDPHRGRDRLLLRDRLVRNKGRNRS